MSTAQLRNQFVSLVKRNQELVSEASRHMDGHHLESEAIDHFYESAFLEVVTRFETFIEDLYFQVALRESSIAQSGIEGALRGVKTRDELTFGLLIAPGLKYLDWLPIKSTIDRANLTLRDGRPFNRLRRRQSEGQLLAEILKIRNAIAHRSASAQQNFEQLCPRGLTRKTPAGYLQQRVNEETTQFQLLCAGLARIAKALAARTDKVAWGFLSPESPWKVGERAPAGEYECRACVSRFVLKREAELGQCATCGPMICNACGAKRTATYDRVAP